MQKKLECKDCNKSYCHLGWALRHSKFKGHTKFKEINNATNTFFSK